MNTVLNNTNVVTEASNINLKTTSITKEVALSKIKDRVVSDKKYRYHNFIQTELNEFERREMSKLDELKSKKQTLSFWDDILTSTNAKKQTAYQCINYRALTCLGLEQEKIISGALRTIEELENKNVYVINFDEYYIYLDSKLDNNSVLNFLEDVLKIINTKIIDNRYNNVKPTIIFIKDNITSIENNSYWDGFKICSNMGFKVKVMN